MLISVWNLSFGRYQYLNGKGGTRRLIFDGVSSLDYRVNETNRYPLFTKITVEIDQHKIRTDLNKKLYNRGWQYSIIVACISALALETNKHFCSVRLSYNFIDFCSGINKILPCWSDFWWHTANVKIPAVIKTSKLVKICQNLSKCRNLSKWQNLSCAFQEIVDRPINVIH